MSQDFSYANVLDKFLFGKNIFSKFLVYIILDRKTMKEKVWAKLEKYPVLLQFVRYLYKILRALKNLLFRGQKK